MAYPDMTPGPPLPTPPPTIPEDTGSTATGSFDVEGAKKAGYSDAEIADHLAASVKFDAPAARKAGYSDKELIAHLTASADPAAGMEGTEEGFQAGYAQRFPQPAPRPAARPAAPKPSEPPPPQDEYSGAPVSTDVAEVDPNASAVGRIGKAVIEGASAPPFLTPEAKAQAERENQGTWVGRNIISPTVALSELPFRGLNALSGGLAQLAYEGGRAIGGPAMGRDFFMGNQLLPVLPGVGGMPHPSVVRAPEAPPGAPPGGRFVSERTAPPRPPGMTDAERMQQLIQHDIVETNPAPGFVPPGTPRPDAGVPVNDILRSDPAQGLGRPAEIPPTTTKDPVTGEVRPIESPPQPTAGETAPPGFRPNVDPTKPFTYNPPSSGWPAGTEGWAENRPRSAEPQPTTVWRSADHDFPVTPTGVEQTHTDGRIYAQVSQPDGSLSYVPKDELVTQGASPQPTAGETAPPAPTSAVPMTADEILARSRQFYTPADQQAAQGAMINPDAADGITGVLRDAVSTDPHKAIAVGNTPLVQLGKDYAPLQGQPMSFDAAMALDRRLTAEKRAAMKSDPDLARQIGEAQDQIRGKTENLGAGDVTGDPQALANLPQARQAYAQYTKQSQLDDIKYGASLLPAEKQDAYVRNQGRALLKSDKSRNWTTEERADLERAVKQGVRGFVGNAAISIIKPLATAAGFKIAGPGGAWLGSTLGESGQATLRDAFARRRPDRLGPVSATITRGVPPPPRNQFTPSVPTIDPTVMSALQEELAQPRARQQRASTQGVPLPPRNPLMPPFAVALPPPADPTVMAERSRARQ